MPKKRTRATPISHDRATFTIRVSGIFERCKAYEVEILMRCRMARSSMASPLVLRVISLARLCLRLRLWGIRRV